MAFNQDYITEQTIVAARRRYRDSHHRNPTHLVVSDFWYRPLLEWIGAGFLRNGEPLPTLPPITDCLIMGMNVRLVEGELPMWCE